MTEIIRGGGFSSWQRTVWSCNCSGMTYNQTMRKIVLPVVVQKYFTKAGNELSSISKTISVLERYSSVVELISGNIRSKHKPITHFQTLPSSPWFTFVLTFTAFRILPLHRASYGHGCFTLQVQVTKCKTRGDLKMTQPILKSNT